jgi:hypothetical protein
MLSDSQGSWSLSSSSPAPHFPGLRSIEVTPPSVPSFLGNGAIKEKVRKHVTMETEPAKVLETLASFSAFPRTL